MLLYPTPFLLSKPLPRQLAPTVGHGVYRTMMQMVFFLQCSSADQQSSMEDLIQDVSDITPFTGSHDTLRTQGSGSPIPYYFILYN